VRSPHIKTRDAAANPDPDLSLHPVNMVSSFGKGLSFVLLSGNFLFFEQDFHATNFATDVGWAQLLD
jgi:hypothetical protein